MNSRQEAANFKNWHMYKNAIVGAAIGGGLGYAAHELADADKRAIGAGLMIGGATGLARAAYNIGEAKGAKEKELPEKEKINKYPFRYTLNNAAKGAMLGTIAGLLSKPITHSPESTLYGAAGGLAAGTLYSMYKLAKMKK